jgi:dinuclear metal center YbgI/SA1388 family protein
MGATLKQIVEFLDRELDIDGFTDSSANGLQVEGRADVRRVGLAVDACVPSFRAAAERGSDLLVVHHGLIWDGVRAVRGVFRKRLAFLLESDVGLYAAHIPLDAHAKLGNNVLLARALGLRKLRPFCRYRGRAISFAGELARPVAARDLAERMAKKLSTRTRVVGDRRARVRRIGVVSGGGSFAVNEAEEAGLDALFTGEGTHAADLDAAESGVVVIYAGHYETETLGVKAVGKALAKRFGVRAEFLP